MSSAILFRRATASSARAFSTSSPRSLARITLIGHLADTPELQPTSNGGSLVRYAVASNSGPRDNRQTSWFRVTSFADGPQRDYLLSLPKGSHVYVEGDASQRQYQDANGETRTGFSIVQRSIEVLKRGQSGENQAGEA